MGLNPRCIEFGMHSTSKLYLNQTYYNSYIYFSCLLFARTRIPTTDDSGKWVKDTHLELKSMNDRLLPGEQVAFISTNRGWRKPGLIDAGEQEKSRLFWRYRCSLPGAGNHVHQEIIWENFLFNNSGKIFYLYYNIIIQCDFVRFILGHNN